MRAEAEFQRWIQRCARQLGWFDLHIYRSQMADGSWRTTTNRNGWPDLTLIRPRGPMLLLEVKAEGGICTPEQLDIVRTLQTMPGVAAFIVRPSDRETVHEMLLRPWDFANAPGEP